jgi:uncharacterized cupredoxin-like copper-binding protein
MVKQLFTFFGALILVLLLAACGAAAGNTTGGNASSTEGNTSSTVQVTETDYHIASSVTSFTPGTTYHFVVTNDGQTAHEFMIMPRSEGSMNGMPMANMDKMALASIDTINPGETRTLNYTFPSSMVNAHPEFACYLPGHYESGMKLDVATKA